MAPLPPTVTLEVNDDPDGLKVWANHYQPNAFVDSSVDSVRSGSLPYDIILPVLNSSLDNPIATSSCQHSDSFKTGDGEFELNDVLDNFGEWWAPILVINLLRTVFALMLAIFGCCFCCCRFCGKCSGDLEQQHRKNINLRYFILYVMLVLYVCLIAVVFAFVSNEKLNDSAQNFNNTINSTINGSLNFIDDTQMQANATIDRYDEINTIFQCFLQCQINNSHITLGGIVLDAFGGLVAPLIKNDLELTLALIVTIILIVGLLLGAIGFRGNTESPYRTQISHYGGITILCCEITLILFLVSFTFLLGANILKVCYSIAEDPLNDDIPSSMIVDNNDLWGGSKLGCFILDDMNNGYRANRAVYDVAQLRMRQNLSLDEVTNITQDGRALLDYAGSEDVDSENLRLGNITHYVMNGTKKKITSLLDRGSGQDTSISHDPTSSANTDHLSVEDVTEGYMDGELLGPDVRVALLRAEGSGKTCLSHTMVKKDYQDTPPTEGVDHMEIVVENTTDWQPLTDEQKLDDLEKQKCLEAMHMSATRPRQSSSIATSSSTPPVIPAVPLLQPLHLPTSHFSLSQLYSGQSFPPIQHNLSISAPPTYMTNPVPLLQPANFFVQLFSTPNIEASYSGSKGSFASIRIIPPPKSKRQKLPRLPQNKTEFFSIKNFQSLIAIREPYNPKKKHTNIWDFAGPAVFQHAHGIFFSEHVVCLIVSDASLSLDEVPECCYPDDHTPHRTVLQTICYWMEPISSHVSKPSTSEKDHSVCLPTFILVGTHIDKLHPDIAIAEVLAFKKFLSGFKKELVGKSFSLHFAGSKKKNLFERKSPSLFFICNKKEKRNPAVINALKQITLQSASITRQTRSTRYVEVERKLMLLFVQERICIRLTQLAEVAKSCGLHTNQEELLNVTSYLHHKRTLLHFQNVPSLSNTIILSPLWMAKLLTYVLTSLTCLPADPLLAQYAEKRQKEGLLEEELIDWSVEGFNNSESSGNRIVAEQCSILVVELFIGFLLIVIVDITQSSLAGKKSRGKGKSLFSVPHLLPCEELPPSKATSFRFLFYFPGHFIPDNLVDQLIVKCARWNNDRHYDLLRLSNQWVCLNLGPYQVYEVKPVDQHHYIELTIIPDPAMPPEYEVESYKESRELIIAVKGFIQDIMKEHMTAIVEESPVECFIPCRFCNELHIKLELFCNTGSAYCPTRRDYCDLPKYHKMVTTNRGTSMQSETTSSPDMQHFIDCKKAYVNLKSQYSDFSALSIDSILPTLFEKDVVTLQEKKIIQNDKLKGMETFLDMVLESLSKNYTGMFIGFRETLLSSENKFLQHMATRLSGGPSQVDITKQVTSPPPSSNESETTPPTPDMQKPTMRRLIKVMTPKIAFMWETVADFLDYNISTIKSIKRKYRDDCEECLNGLFRDWLSTNNGVGPKNWVTLLKRLKEIDQLGGIISDIESKLKELGILNS